MRILFITASYLPTINGVSLQINILKRELEKRGHEVFLLAPKFPGYKDNENNVIRLPSIPDPLVKNYPLGIPIFSIKKIKKMAPEIVHVHHPFIFGQFGITISEKVNIPLVFTAHTEYQKYADYYFPSGRFLSSRLINKSLVNLSKKCAMVICPSKTRQKELKAIGIRNTIVISNSIDGLFFKMPKMAKRPRRFTIVYTGRLEREKNPFLLLKVCKELKILTPTFRMLIIGSGSLSEKLQKKSWELELGENVEFIGEIERKYLPNIYKKAQLFLTASISEVMPLTLIEAIASGLPIIALKKSGLEDIVIEGLTGYLMKPNPKIIAAKILRLISNNQLLSKLSENAYRHALNFSVSKKAKDLENLYRQVLVSR